MTGLDADLIRRTLGGAHSAELSSLEVFPEIESTNSYLMQQEGPEPGMFRVAASDNQTAGRGRHGKTWQSPPGSGLCLSMAYTFARSPENLPALTLAIGLGVIENFGELGIEGVQLKWPNDLIAMDGKLGGILTEAQTRHGGAVTVVSGIGVNVELPGDLDLGAEAEGALRVVDLQRCVGHVPPSESLASCLIQALRQTFLAYERHGFAKFSERWQEQDWLRGRALMIDAPGRRVKGVGAGVAQDGALLVETSSDGLQRVTSGSVMITGKGDKAT